MVLRLMHKALQPYRVLDEYSAECLHQQTSQDRTQELRIEAVRGRGGGGLNIEK